MSKMACEMLTDIDKDTIDWDPNFDETKKEPHVLPSRFPNLLVNGSQGIAVGMATNIPPHNLSEVIDGCIAYIDDPDIDLPGLMEYIKGPDFPTAGIIMGRSGIRAAYATGRGKITLRGRATIEETKNGRTQIIITEIPYMVNKARLIENMADLVKDKRIEGITGLNDETNRKGMRIVVDIRKDANAQVILNQLYQYTQLQDTVGVIMLAIDHKVPKVMTLKQMIQKYVEFQDEVVRRRTQYDLKKAKERAHILEGLKKATDIVDELIATIRACKGGMAEAKAAIRKVRKILFIVYSVFKLMYCLGRKCTSLLSTIVHFQQKSTRKERFRYQKAGKVIFPGLFRTLNQTFIATSSALGIAA